MTLVGEKQQKIIIPRDETARKTGNAVPVRLGSSIIVKRQEDDTNITIRTHEQLGPDMCVNESELFLLLTNIDTQYCVCQTGKIATEFILHVLARGNANGNILRYFANLR